MGNDRSRLDVEAKRDALFAGALKNVRSAALAAALVPLALVAVPPSTAHAQSPCPSGGCPVPEPAALLLLAPAGAALLWRQRRKGKK